MFAWILNNPVLKIYFLCANFFLLFWFRSWASSYVEEKSTCLARALCTERARFMLSISKLTFHVNHWAVEQVIQMFSFIFPSVKRNTLEQTSENLASYFSVLSGHHKRVFSVKVQKEFMQFDCSACFISYFMAFLKFTGKCKFRLCDLHSESCSHGQWSLLLN